MAKSRKRVDAFYMPTFICNMASCQVAMSYGLHGPTTTPVLACATGTYAIGEAARTCITATRWWRSAAAPTRA